MAGLPAWPSPRRCSPASAAAACSTSSISRRHCRASASAPCASAISSTASCGARPPNGNTASWCPIPTTGQLIGRHASQLYEAFFEGLVTFALVWWFARKPRPRGTLAGLFLVWYALVRIGVEFVRVPDAQIGYLMQDWLTMGQLLSWPMLLAGVWLLLQGRLQGQPSGNYSARA